MFTLLLACGLTSNPTPAPSAGPTAASNAKETLDRAKVSTDLSALRAAIRLYQGEHEGTNPPTLSDLSVNGLYYAGYYEYDPMTGSVTCPEHPAL